MKKKLIIIIALLLVGAAVFVVINANSIAAKFKPEIERVASQSLGKQVSLGELQVTLFPSVSLVSTGVRVGSASSSDLKLKELVFKLGLSGLLSGKLDISELKLVGPDVVVRKNAEGLSVGGIASKPKGAKAAPAETEGGKPAETKGALPAWASLDLERFALSEGTLKFIDEPSKLTVELTPIELSTKVSLADSDLVLPELDLSFAVNKTLEVAFESSDLTYNLASSKASLPQASVSALAGKFGLKGSFDQKGGIADLELSTIRAPSLAELSKLSSLLPALANLKLSGAVAPALQLALRNNSPSVKGKLALQQVGLDQPPLKVAALNGTVELKAQGDVSQARSSDLVLNLNSEQVKAQFEARFDKQLNLKPITVEMAGGKVESSLVLTPADKTFSANFKLAALQIERLIAAFKPDLAGKLKGTLHDINGEVRGALGENLMASLAGQVRLDVRDTFIPGVNLAAKTLGAVKDLPFLQGPLLRAVPEPLMAELNSESTVVKSVTGDCNIADGGLNTGNLYVLSNIFSLQGAGRIGFDSSVKLKATIIFSKAFSEALLAKVKELRAIANQEGQLAIPLQIEGRGSEINVIPDAGKLLRAGAENLLKDKAGDLINKALGGKKSGKGGLGGLLGF